MKKKEIEAIIKDNPTAVFALNGNYIQYVVITGFKQVSRTKYATPTTYQAFAAVLIQTADLYCANVGDAPVPTVIKILLE